MKKSFFVFCVVESLAGGAECGHQFDGQSQHTPRGENTGACDDLSSLVAQCMLKQWPSICQIGGHPSRVNRSKFNMHNDK